MATNYKFLIFCFVQIFDFYHFLLFMQINPEIDV